MDLDLYDEWRTAETGVDRSVGTARGANIARGDGIS
jgi:hypothetical protein